MAARKEKDVPLVLTPEQEKEIGDFVNDLPDGDDDDDDFDDDDDDDGGDDGSGEGAAVGEGGPGIGGPGVEVDVRNTSRPRDEPPPRRGPGRPPAKAHTSRIRGPNGMPPAARAASPALRSLREKQETAYAEIDSMLAELNFAEREYEVRLTRLEPTHDDDGNQCAGYLRSYKTQVSLDDIAREHGGGVYQLTIHGPRPNDGRVGLISQKKITISGAAKVKRRGGRRDNEEGGLSTVLEAQARTFENMIDRIQPAGGLDLEKVLVPLVTKFFDRQDAGRQEADRLAREEREKERQRREEEREDRRREEERREKREEERRREEREARQEEERKREKEEERKREEERQRREEERERREEEREKERQRREDERRAEDKRREEERERQREERERERERREEERERLREERAEEQRRHERELAAAQERRKEEREAQKQAADMQRELLTAQLEMLEKRSESGGLKQMAESLMMLNNLRATLSGEDGGGSKIDEFAEGAEKLASTFMPMVGGIANAIRGGKGGQQQQQPQQQRPIVVDIGPANLPKQLPAQPTTNGAPPVANPASTNADEPPVIDQPIRQNEDGQAVNGYKAVRIPTAEQIAGWSLQDQAVSLICNIDFAVQQNMSAEQIVDQILDPYDDVADSLMAMLGGFDADRLMAFLPQHVPPEWAILSPRGEGVVREAFELWQDDDGEEEAA